jgi:hypothetical protein
MVEQMGGGEFLYASKISASPTRRMKPVSIRRQGSWGCLLGIVHAYAGCDRRAFVLTPRAAYQPARPRNSEMFLRSVGTVYSMGARGPGSRLPSRRGMDLRERCVGSRDADEEPWEEP